MATTVKEPTRNGKRVSHTRSRTQVPALFVAVLFAAAALAVVCVWLLFRQQTMMGPDELDRHTAQLEQELAGARSDCERQQAELAQQQARIEEQQAQLAQQQAQIDEQQAQLAQAQDTIDQLSQSVPQYPDGEVPEYVNMFPDFYAPEWTGGAASGGRVCYLTFDDGPSSSTDKILETLDQYGVKATFFIVGSNATSAASQERMRKIVDSGHTIAMHSWSHSYNKIYASVEAFLTEFNQLYEYIYEVTGVYPSVYRFPGGSINSYNQSTYQEIIAEMTRRGFVYYDWNVSTGDATSKVRPVDLIIEDSLKGIGIKSAIILGHDTSVRTTTVEALPAIIEAYQAAGYTFSGLNPGVKPVIFGYPKVK